MNQSKDLKHEETPQTLQIWCCDNCRAVHFKAGNVLLNFTKEEFAELTYSVNDLFQHEFGSLEFYHLISSLRQNEEILTSQNVS